MPTSTAPLPTNELEAVQLLTAMTHRKSGRIDGALLVRHVIAVTPEGDWAVRHAAMEAVLRRIAAAREDALAVAERPKGSIAGRYVLQARSQRRPYAIELRSWSPIQGCCDCEDFQKNSLAICKHLLAIVDDVAHRQTKRQTRLPEAPSEPAARLAWDPICPLTGSGDWLERLRWSGSRVPRRLIRWLRPDGQVDPQSIETLESRLELVRALQPSVEAAEPVIRPLVTAELEHLQRLRDLQGVTVKIPAELEDLKQRLYPYQLAGVTRAVSSGRLLLADDMGLGKTIQAIAVCHVLSRARKVRRGLLIVPASLKSQWAREWSSFTGVPVRIVEGAASERAAFYDVNTDGFLIANYEQIPRDIALINAWDPELVVLDEAQRIKNWQTKTSAAVKKLDPRYRLVLTGTPMENRLDELASIMEWVDARALEPRWRLAPWHTRTADGSRERVGAKNLDTLRQRLAPGMLRRRRSEVLTELPSRTDTRVPVDLTPEQLEEHSELDLPIRRLVSMGQQRPLRQEEFLRLMMLLTRQRMICNGLALAEYDELAGELEKSRPTDTRLASLFSPKLRELREVISNVVIGQEQKVVIFSQWRRMLVLAQWAVADLLEQAKLRSVFFSGQESLKRRAQNIVDLHDDPATRVLFATDAGGVGLNLQRAATCCINLELPWNPAVLEQRIGRIHRNGQKRPVEVYNLVSNGGIEWRIADLIADKRALFSGLFDGTTDEVKFDGSGSFLTRVEKLLDPKASAEPPPADDGRIDLVVEDLMEQQEPSVPEEAAPVPAQPPPPPEITLPAPAEMQRLFSDIRVQTMPDGGISISAPREAASSLATLFGELARKLAEAAR